MATQKVRLILNNFFYFGKLPFHEEFIGNFPPAALRKLLDGWSVPLNKQPIPRWQEKVIFGLATKKNKEFVVGVFWNSEDGRGRKYPFVIYRKIVNCSGLGLLPVQFLDLNIVAEIILKIWNFSDEIPLSQLDMQLKQDGKIAKLFQGSLRTEEEGNNHATVYLHSSASWQNWQAGRVAPQQWQRTLLRDFAQGNARKKTVFPSCCLLYPPNSSFAAFIEKHPHLL